MNIQYILVLIEQPPTCLIALNPSCVVFLFHTNKVPRSPLLQVRYLSGERGGGRKGFLGEFLDNLKTELNKNKEMKDNIKKFREEAKKLEESDALKQARRKYVSFWPHTHTQDL